MGHRLLIVCAVLAWSCERPSVESRKLPTPLPSPAPQHELAQTANQNDAGTDANPLIDESRLRSALQRWADVQNAGDFEAYQTLYANGFRGIKRVGNRKAELNHQSWIQDRARMFRRPVHVKIDDVRIVSTAQAGSEVVFKQTWSSGGFQDIGTKRIVFASESNELRITFEEMLDSTITRAQQPLLHAAVQRAEQDPDHNVYQEVRDLMRAAGTEQDREVLVRAVTTIDYGCRCPDFVFDVLYGAAPYEGVDSPHVYPIVDAGPSPRDYLLPSMVAAYDLWGKLERTPITGEAWLRRLGLDPLAIVQREQLDAYWKDEGPVLQVTRWCLRVDREDANDPDYGSTIQRAVADGVVCGN